MSNPFWLDDDAAPALEQRLDGPPDVEIVGAGITGCSCALVLARAGKRVRVHDERAIAEGASGRNGGFALRGGAARYDVARESYGADRTRELWRRTEAALDRLTELGGDAVRRNGSLRLAADEEELGHIQAEYEALRADGFDVEWRGDLPERLAGEFLGAMFHPGDGAVQPARVVRRIAAAAAAAGAEFREHSRVSSLEELAADAVVLATDGYGRGLVADLDERIWPARGQVVTTEPLPERLYDYPHYARHGFDYWQQLPDGRLLLGGFRDFSMLTELTDEETTTDVIQEALERFLAELVGYPPRVTHRARRRIAYPWSPELHTLADIQRARPALGW